MEYSTYHYNIALTIAGFICAMDSILYRQRLRKKFIAGTTTMMFACIFGITGLWNLICLLVKLNVIHP